MYVYTDVYNLIIILLYSAINVCHLSNMQENVDKSDYVWPPQKCLCFGIVVGLAW